MATFEGSNIVLNNEEFRALNELVFHPPIDTLELRDRFFDSPDSADIRYNDDGSFEIYFDLPNDAITVDQ